MGLVAARRGELGHAGSPTAADYETSQHANPLAAGVDPVDGGVDFDEGDDEFET